MTQDELKQILSYCPITGHFTWLSPRANRVKIGDRAGCINKLDGYRQLVVNSKKYKEHRLVWFYVYGIFPTNTIDHINGIRDDNRLVNLREATLQQQNQNLTIRNDNSSGFTGVYWSKAASKWQAYIDIDGKRHHLGLFENKQDAYESRIKKKKELHTFNPIQR